MQVLYPDIKPYKEHSIIVDMPHRLYVEECGNPNGLPVVFLHGGPGAGCEVFHRRFFDPQKYRIVLFDQRGCGRSTPHASLKNNCTQDLVRDMEVIREHLGIDQWVLFGGSWGSTLALLYAQAHPERVLGMILRGIFLCRRKDIDWFYREGANRIFPDHWEELLKPLKGQAEPDVLTGYHRLLNGENELQRMAAAKAWSSWEGSCATLRPNQSVLGQFTDGHTALSLSKIEVHYFINNAFIEENQILNNMAAIQDIPGIIVHGRYDMICPMDQAQELHRNWLNSELNIIRDAGHSSMEPGIVNALIKATDEMARKQNSRA
ncbi:prolyl aminopeptidase [Ketobacter sp.]|uniref:prolyl aminopeptidase n=1 Tax=Ketobacter sp. TaxID=2083498 RepID=UPI000F131C16|nr:prolyl aminopeptidase [Ketobacter sp.]RLT93084.1 MAG: prolyl aminopeptidase [Ketobacter sp.]